MSKSFTDLHTFPHDVMMACLLQPLLEEEWRCGRDLSFAYKCSHLRKLGAINDFPEAFFAKCVTFSNCNLILPIYYPCGPRYINACTYADTLWYVYTNNNIRRDTPADPCMNPARNIVLSFFPHSSRTHSYSTYSCADAIKGDSGRGPAIQKRHSCF